RGLPEPRLTLNAGAAASRGFRLLNWNGIHVDDCLLAGNEFVQVGALPKGPDEDTFLKSFMGQRLAFEDTTPEAHAANSTAYKVSLHPLAPAAASAGNRLAPSGLPVVTLYYPHDAGGPAYATGS